MCCHRLPLGGAMHVIPLLYWIDVVLSALLHVRKTL